MDAASPSATMETEEAHPVIEAECSNVAAFDKADRPMR